MGKMEHSCWQIAITVLARAFGYSAREEAHYVKAMPEALLFSLERPMSNNTYLEA